MATENNFPTISDLRDLADTMIDRGFGELPIQIVVVPDSTLQSIAGHQADGKPAIMLDFTNKGGRMALSFISADRLQDRGMSLAVN